MSINSHEDKDILIGATGWNHDAWIGSYYPEDLPADWRLSFYSNEFNTVLVPERDWVNKKINDIEQWVDDTHEEFIFFFELNLVTLTLIDQIQQAINLLEVPSDYQDQLGGFLITVPPEADETDMHNIRTILPQNFPISLNFSKNTLPEAKRQDILSSLWVNAIWHSHGISNKHQQNNNLQLGILDTKTVDSNKQLKNYFEQFRVMTETNSPKALFLSGDPPNINHLRDIKMIKELIIG